MHTALDELFDAQGGVATSGQILAVVPRYKFESVLKSRYLERVWNGVYCLGEPTDELRLRGLNLSCGTAVPVCLGSAA
ncbi:hypothetical protein IPW42_26125, partial [Mycobacteroides abscessus subsp. massiliense]|nr:hypothetical protein [Mycobacteroides abscessus subsp. massiliense]